MRPSEQLYEAIFGLGLRRKKKPPRARPTRPYSTSPLKDDELADWFGYLISPEGNVYGCQFGSHEDLEKALAQKGIAPKLKGASRRWYSTKLIEKGWAKISAMGAHVKTEMPDTPTGAQNRAVRDIIGAHIDASKQPHADPGHEKFVRGFRQ